jgi:hypothetical protein
MNRRVFLRAALAAAGAVALTVATALPGDAAATNQWRFSAYESSLTGSMYSVVALSRTNAWAEGTIYHGENPVYSMYVLHWNGAKWSTVTIPGSSGYAASQVSASSASNVWVLGSDVNGDQKIFRYDGSHWHTVSVPGGSSVGGLLVLSATDAWLMGGISCVDSPKAAAKCVSAVWQWNGGTWLAHPINSSVYSIDASSGSNVWAVGLGGVNAKGEGTVAAYRWAGTHWTPVVMSHPDMSGWPNISVSSAGNVWIEGWRGATSQVLALHWNGSKWQQVISPSQDAAAPDAVPYGSSGVWMGSYVVWTGRGWINTTPQPPFWGGVIEDVVPIPGASGSYWGTASASKTANSSVDHPAMMIYGPLP